MAMALRRSQSALYIGNKPSKIKSIDVETFQRRQAWRSRMKKGLRKTMSKETLQDALMFHLQRKLIRNQEPVPKQLVRGPRMQKEYRKEANKILHNKDVAAVKAIDGVRTVHLFQAPFDC